MVKFKLEKNKRFSLYSYIFIFIVTLANCFSASIVQAQVNGQGVATGDNLTSQLVRQGTNRMWEVLFIGQDGNTNGTITAIILSFMNIVTFLVLLIELIKLYREMTNPSNTNESLTKMVFDKIVPSVVVFALITANGVLLSSGVLGLRNAAYNIDGKISATMTRIADVNRIAADYQGEEVALRTIGDKQKDCSRIPATVSGKPNPVLKTCLQEFQALVDENINSGAIKSSNVVQNLRDASRSDNPLIKIGAIVVNAVASAPSAAIKAIIDGYLLLIGLLFAIAVEISMLIMAIISSVAVAMSLFNLKPLIEWLSKFAGLVIMKVSYTISIGAFQVFSDTAGANLIDGLINAAFGIAAPAIAILIAWQSSGIVGAGVNAGVFRIAAAGAKILSGSIAGTAGKAVGGSIASARSSMGRSSGRSSPTTRAVRK